MEILLSIFSIFVVIFFIKKYIKYKNDPQREVERNERFLKELEELPKRAEQLKLDLEQLLEKGKQNRLNLEQELRQMNAKKTHSSYSVQTPKYGKLSSVDNRRCPSCHERFETYLGQTCDGCLRDFCHTCALVNFKSCNRCANDYCEDCASDFENTYGDIKKCDNCRY